MVRISRKEGESIVIYSENPEITKQLGNGRVEIVIKKVVTGEQCRSELAISAPKGVQILRRELKSEGDLA